MNTLQTGSQRRSRIRVNVHQNQVLQPRQQRAIQREFIPFAQQNIVSVHEFTHDYRPVLLTGQRHELARDIWRMICYVYQRQINHNLATSFLHARDNIQIDDNVYFSCTIQGQYNHAQDVYAPFANIQSEEDCIAWLEQYFNYRDEDDLHAPVTFNQGYMTMQRDPTANGRFGQGLKITIVMIDARQHPDIEPLHDVLYNNIHPVMVGCSYQQIELFPKKDLVRDANLYTKQGYPVVIKGFQIANSKLCPVKVGAYELQNPAEIMFYKKTITQFFADKKVVISTPETKSLSCFLMSVIRAQAVQYDFRNGKCVGVKDCSQRTLSPYVRTPLECFRCCLPKLWDECPKNSYGFCMYIQETRENYIRLFNLYKLEGVSKEDVESEQYYWELAARELEHLLVTNDPTVDVNDLQSIGQAVADTFELCISIYDAEYFGKRCWCFTPQRFNLHELVAVGKIKLINLVYDHGHIYAIQDVVKYFLSFHPTKSTLKNYCPICEKIGGRDLRTWEELYQHIDKCIKSKQMEGHFACLSYEKRQEYDMECSYSPLALKFNKVLKSMEVCCRFCNEPMSSEENLFHCCPIKPLEQKENLKNEKIFAYDLESAQVLIEGKQDLYYHRANLVMVRSLADGNNVPSRDFETEIEFMDALMTEERYENGVFLAHNGSSYDGHFIVRYLERMQILHSVIPTPNSFHKFLQISIPERGIIFLDFMYFMPGSLRSIAQAFHLEVQKGDFPHRFNNGLNDHYVGAIPPIDQHDYWGLNHAKSEEHYSEILSHFHLLQSQFCHCLGQCECALPKWDFRVELRKYCDLDVRVLARAAFLYRQQFLELGELAEHHEECEWQCPSIDPFQFMTVPQLAFNLLLYGFQGEVKMMNLMDRKRRGQSPYALLWLEDVQRILGHKIYHRKNWHKEYFSYEMKQFVDGYDSITKTCYICLKCDLWGCPHCKNIIPTDNHPIFRRPWLDILQERDRLLTEWDAYGNAIIKWECEVQAQYPISIEYQPWVEEDSFHKYFYGGRTEVFNLYRQPKEDEEIKYLDVCSLYPFVCAHKELPCGVPEIIPGHLINPERLFHTDRNIKYWGYIKCKVLPNPNDKIGLLPYRQESGKLCFPIHEMIGCWGLNELELAVQNGYRILQVYEIIHFNPDNRSDRVFKEYISTFLRMKQESEGWLKLGASQSNPTEREKIELIERLFQENGCIGRVRSDCVEVNPLRRALAKLALNSVWGKIAQKVRMTVEADVYNMQNFLEIFHDPRVVKSSFVFRLIGNSYFRVRYDMEGEFVKPNARGNVLIAAKVTEWARCVLHTQMLRIGPDRIIYCDTDSIVACVLKGVLYAQKLIGNGLGKWVDEYKKYEIMKFYAIAPKFYLVVTANKCIIKAKGVQMTRENELLLTEEAMKKLIMGMLQNERQEIPVQHFTIAANVHANLGLQHGVMLTRYTEKKVRVQITKRQILIPIQFDFQSSFLVDTKPLELCN